MRWLAVALVFVSVPLSAAVPGPERAVTDPTSIRSASNPAAHPVPIHDLFFTHGIAGAAWSPDGREIVISTNTSGRYNLWKVPATGGSPVQITRSDDREYGATWSPDGKWIVYGSDQGGNEQFKLYAVPAKGGAPVSISTATMTSHAMPRLRRNPVNMYGSVAGSRILKKRVAGDSFSTRATLR